MDRGLRLAARNRELLGVVECVCMPDELQAEMISAAGSAVKHARKYWSTELDYSPNSIEEVELILARMHESLPRNRFLKLLKRGPSEEQMAQLAIAYGAYIGEVFRREFGGEWSKEQIMGQQDVLSLKFTSQNMIFPAGKVWKRLQNGDEDNVWAFFQLIRRRLQEPEGKA